MAEVPPPPKPKKARFPAPEVAKNKPAGIPKSYYASPEGRRIDDRLNTQHALWGDRAVYGVDYPHNHRLVTANEQPYPRQIDPTLPHLPFQEGDPSTAYGTQALRNTFLDPDLGAGMRRPPPPNQFPPVRYRDPLPRWDVDLSRLADAERDWKKWARISSSLRVPSPEPDLALIHPEAREGLVPNRRLFPSGIPVGPGENRTELQRYAASIRMDGGYDIPPPGEPNARAAIRRGYRTQRLSPHVPAPPQPPRLVRIPAPVAAGETLGIPLTRGGLLGAFATGAGDAALGIYDPISQQALYQALQQTQDQIEQTLLTQQLLQGIRASRGLLHQGLNTVAGYSAPRAQKLFNLAIPPPPPMQPPGRPIPPNFKIPNPFVR